MQKIIASHNPDPEIRKLSSSGGVFWLIAEKILSANGVVYGVGFDKDWHIAHIRVDNMAGLRELSGSKYAYSKPGDSLNRIKTDLANGRKVLFSGTPCQIAAIRKGIGDNQDITLVEIVCHGAPDSGYWEKYLDEICSKHNRDRNDIKNISFRDKRAGWKNYNFTIQFADGYEFTQPHEDNLYMRAFLKNYTVREACFRCPFKYPHGSCADITIGDFWGIDQIAPQIDNNLGTTLVIGRTEKGLRIISTLEWDCDIEYNAACRHNPAICSAPVKPADRDAFLQEIKNNGSIIKVFKHFASLSIHERYQRLYLKIARLKRKILN